MEFFPTSQASSLLETRKDLVADAQSGNPIAMLYIGNLFETGEEGGMSKDVEKALFFYKLAARMGLEEAEARLLRLKANLKKVSPRSFTVDAETLAVYRNCIEDDLWEESNGKFFVFDQDRCNFTEVKNADVFSELLRKWKSCGL